MARQASPEKRFRQCVAYHRKEIEDTVGFQTDEEWMRLVVSKILQLSDPVNGDELVLLAALIEVWATNRGIEE